MMKALLSLLLFPCVWFAPARDVVAVVAEKTYARIPGVSPTERVAENDKVATFSITLDKMRSVPYEGAHGRCIPAITKYSIKDATSDWAGLGKKDLCDGDRHLFSAQN